MKDAPPKRRWFRFSLRMMFLTLTAACIWTGYLGIWIRLRHGFLLDVRNGFYMTVWCDEEQSTVAPRGLWLFGEKGIRNFKVHSKAMKGQVEWLFPESVIDEA